jgi:serine/threonine-protein kinase
LVLDPNLIPGFEILDRIASGGVAEVFRAQRVADGQEVALKVMSLSEFDSDFRPVERFEREGALLERLHHPSLPRFFGYGVTPGGLGWLALELVRGQPLSLYKGRPPLELIPIFIQVAEGLQAVGEEGIVHRDISPDNILVEERHGRAHARLIDFGVAKDLLAGGPGASLTQHGAFIGKLAYASPEQLMGLPKGETIDFRSDVYSLGMTMYELLAGRRAIQGDGLPEVVDAHIKGIYAPLSVSPENGGPATRLVALVTRMIARKREDRPSSWEEVLAELWRAREEVSPLSETLARKRSGTGQYTAVAPPPRQPSAPNFTVVISREERFGRVVLAAGAIAFVAAVAFAVWFLKSRASASGREPTPAPVSSPAATAATGSTATSAPSPTNAPVSSAPPTAAPLRPTAVPPTAVPAKAKATPPPKPTKRPKPTATPTSLKGTLVVSLVPDGDLDEVVDESGRRVVSRRSLPASLELPVGRYRLKLVGKGLDCTKTVSVTVRAGKATAVSESCIEVK